MKFRRETPASVTVSILALLLLLGEVANPSLAEFGFQVPRAAGLVALGLLFVSQRLMIEYQLPPLPRRAPKIFNMFNFYICLAIAGGLLLMAMYMEVLPMKINNHQMIAMFLLVALFMYLCTVGAKGAYRNLLSRYGAS